METILRDLRQPEYLHVLLNPIPVYGLAIALFGLIAATYLRSRGGQLTALVLIFACAISVWAVVRQGDLAYNPVLSKADEDGQAWLKAHAHRADELIFLYRERRVALSFQIAQLAPSTICSELDGSQRAIACSRSRSSLSR